MDTDSVRAEVEAMIDDLSVGDILPQLEPWQRDALASTIAAKILARHSAPGEGISAMIVDRLRDMGHAAIVTKAEDFILGKLAAAEAAKGGE